MHVRATQRTDQLTGLDGYDAFAERLTSALQAAAAEGLSVSIALFDIDWFAKLNDEHGHEVGDAVLREVARHLSKTFGDHAALFRYGGDAFVALFEGMERERAFLLAEKARDTFDGEHTVRAGTQDVSLPASISAGVSAYPDDGNSDTDLVRKANEALYRAKVTGPNKVCLGREEKMVTKTSHYTQGQLQGLARIAKRMGMGEAELLREGLDDLLRKYNA
ncbi:MAG TPA: diguanylate cyclase [Candidatus Hydrogenedentes bacterium]|nr:diguanylate cyclase [Candidatus Hydrogenedentota bacterium]HIJ74674.1 diguanylate cyclase [Candidatus Hydrogenedentota bacterium]